MVWWISFFPFSFAYFPKRNACVRMPSSLSCGLMLSLCILCILSYLLFFFVLFFCWFLQDVPRARTAGLVILFMLILTKKQRERSTLKKCISHFLTNLWRIDFSCIRYISLYFRHSSFQQPLCIECYNGLFVSALSSLCKLFA